MPEKSLGLQPNTWYTITLSKPRVQGKQPDLGFKINNDALRYLKHGRIDTQADLNTWLVGHVCSVRDEKWVPGGQQLRAELAAEKSKEHVKALLDLGWREDDGTLYSPDTDAPIPWIDAETTGDEDVQEDVQED